MCSDVEMSHDFSYNIKLYVISFPNPPGPSRTLATKSPGVPVLYGRLQVRALSDSIDYMC